MRGFRHSQGIVITCVLWRILLDYSELQGLSVIFVPLGAAIPM